MVEEISDFVRAEDMVSKSSLLINILSKEPYTHRLFSPAYS